MSAETNSFNEGYRRRDDESGVTAGKHGRPGQRWRLDLQALHRGEGGEQSKRRLLEVRLDLVGGVLGRRVPGLAFAATARTS